MSEQQEQHVRNGPTRFKENNTPTVGSTESNMNMTTTTLPVESKTSSSSSSSAQKIYGQEEEQKQLIKTFERSCGQNSDRDDDSNQRSEVTVIAGPSGSGKTMLARMLQNRSKYFVLGKCDQFQQGSEPFGPFIVALTQLAHQVLQEDAEILQQLRSNMQNAIPEVVQVDSLIDMVQSLAPFFPNMNHKGNSNIQNPFESSAMQHPDVENPILEVIYNFLRSICSTERSLVMVIDDIQWIDYSSLELVKKLTEEKPIQGFMLMTTCRDDEMTDDNPAAQVLKNLQEDDNDAKVLYVSLGNLTLEAVNDIAADRFPTLPVMGLEALSSVLHQHTKGNAFFVTQLIRRLENSGWKTHKYQEEMKGWDFDDHRSMVDRFIKYDCDALVDFLVVDTANESPLIRRVLKTSSCLGSNFVTSHVMMVLNESKDDILGAISLMEDRGIINRRTENDDDGGWSWAHDKYQRAAYLMIDSKERKRFHLEVGRQLLSNLDDDELQQYIFIVVSQFGIALKLIEEDEKERIANLFLQAGKKSALSSSFTAAASYFSMGTSLLREDNWTSQYDLSLSLYTAAAEMECFRGHYQQTDKLVNVILRHTTKTLKDRIRAYEIKIYMSGAKQETEQVTYLTVDIYRQLGEKLSAKPRFSKILYEVMSTKYMLSGKTEADVLSLPPLQDWKKIAMLQIMQRAFPALIRGNPDLAAIVACRCMKLTLRHGICGMSCGAFAAVGTILIHPLGFIEEAIRLVRISGRIVEEYGVDDMKCRQYLVLYAYTLPYKFPLRDSLEWLERGARLGLMHGDLDMACLCLESRTFSAVFCGWNLDQMMSMMAENINQFSEWDQQLHVSYSSMQAHSLGKLIDREADHWTHSTNNAFNEQLLMERSVEEQDGLELTFFWLFKAFVELYLGEYTTCSEYMSKLLKYDLNTSSAPVFQQIHFVAALVFVLVAREEQKNGNRYAKPKRKFNSVMNQLQTYAKLGPDNIMNKLYLVEAESAVLKDDRGEAMSKFRASIDHANQQGFIQEEALGNERFAVALLEWGEVTESLEFLERAWKLYNQWGATVKVKRLEEYVQEKFGINNIMWTDRR